MTATSDLWLSEEMVAAFMPIVVYWVYCGIYMALGTSFEDYRLHSKKEDEKNLVSKRTVIKGVLFQQFLQLVIALFLFLVPERTDAVTTSPAGQPFSIIVIAKQIVIGLLVLDACLYFLHRFIWHNKFIYRYTHANHHRLLVPYTYGAIYSHPLEGFGDIISGFLAVFVSGMSLRTSIYFFSFVTIKNVDDHCGFLLPGNPFHILFRNNSAYHDVHHQLNGVKYNFSLLFDIWDRILGTDMPYSLEKREGGGFEVRLTKDCKED